MARQYIGITIGPVVDTLSLTSTPAGLWGASYLFSYVTKKLCEHLVDGHIEPDRFITPYFSMNEGRVQNQEDGVGLFPDRIIFQSIEGDLVKTREIIDEVKRHIGEEISKGLNHEGEDLNRCVSYVAEYLQIYALEYDIEAGENPILVLSKYLDCLELQKSYAQRERENYILSLFNNKGNSEAKNEAIKRSFLVEDSGGMRNWPLLAGADNHRIRDLPRIAQSGTPESSIMKKHRYYAIIQADGDDMGRIVARMETDEEIRSFSKCCQDFGFAASEEIKAYSGIPIYAGGDDLLALAPVENGSGKCIFDLINTIDALYQTCFKTYSGQFENHQTVSISFGVAICYHKYPLYEALDIARHLLFAVAKGTKGKNSLAVNVQKHSGQSFAFNVHGFSDNGNYINVCDLIKSPSADSELLKSVLRKLVLFKDLFEKALAEMPGQALGNVFDNTFDSEIHKGAGSPVAGFIRNVQELLHGLKGEANITGIGMGDGAIPTIDAILRMVHFFRETNRENDE